MIKAITLEFFKLRRKKIFLMITLFLGCEILWAFMSVSISLSRNPNSPVWESTLTTIASMNGLFLPIICAIVSSRICDMENKGNTWKLLISSNLNRKFIYAAKYICSGTLLLYGVVLQAFAITIFTITKSSTVIIPLSLIMRFIGSTMLASMVILALQQWITLAIKNQAFALCFGMIGGFLGIVSDFFPETVRRMVIWSYYTGLCPVKYYFTNGSLEFIQQNPGLGMLTAVFLLIIIFYIAGSHHFSQQEN
ncbi:ABC transporter permease [Caloranaerobacter azorensis H53214]|uniref:ABC transporter permease n=1 Tax=Caloranaerobacter azorensis H53214 TaxID=1156417 RepID=A0A096BGJ9_9FIRM|nr:ABC transporter permease [Caloranaerobacter azorensis]KGG79992.1 ABC transporter permease [Caloranaerobacter azorensis H53214]